MNMSKKSVVLFAACLFMCGGYAHGQERSQIEQIHDDIRTLNQRVEAQHEMLMATLKPKEVKVRDFDQAKNDAADASQKVSDIAGVLGSSGQDVGDSAETIAGCIREVNAVTLNPPHPVGGSPVCNTDKYRNAKKKIDGAIAQASRACDPRWDLSSKEGVENARETDKYRNDGHCKLLADAADKYNDGMNQAAMLFMQLAAVCASIPEPNTCAIAAILAILQKLGDGGGGGKGEKDGKKGEFVGRTGECSNPPCDEGSQSPPTEIQGGGGDLRCSRNGSEYICSQHGREYTRFPIRLWSATTLWPPTVSIERTRIRTSGSQVPDSGIQQLNRGQARLIALFACGLDYTLNDQPAKLIRIQYQYNNADRTVFLAWQVNGAGHALIDAEGPTVECPH